MLFVLFPIITASRSSTETRNLTSELSCCQHVTPNLVSLCYYPNMICMSRCIVFTKRYEYANKNIISWFCINGTVVRISIISRSLWENNKIYPHKIKIGNYSTYVIKFLGIGNCYTGSLWNYCNILKVDIPWPIFI